MYYTLFILIIVVLLVVICASRQSKQENMLYLDQYETQDNYRNIPESWPVIYTSTTALYAAKREALAEEARLRTQLEYASDRC